MAEFGIVDRFGNRCRVMKRSFAGCGYIVRSDIAMELGWTGDDWMKNWKYKLGVNRVRAGRELRWFVA